MKEVLLTVETRVLFVVENSLSWRNQKSPHRKTLIENVTMQNNKPLDSEEISLRKGFEPTNLTVHWMEPTIDTSFTPKSFFLKDSQENTFKFQIT